MSKTKKIATAVVSVVMASAMCASLAVLSACTDTNLSLQQDKLEVTTDSSGALTYADGTSLNMNVGYKAAYGYISYTQTQVSESFYMAGSTYNTSSLKPAWAALSSELGITYVDRYQENDSDGQINDTTNYSSYDMITGSADLIVQYATADNDQYIDLSLYLDYMPNFKAFLEENPIVQLSLTSDTETGAIYYAPYFDGNDDIEKYELANQYWVEALLGSTTPTSATTFASAVQARQYDTDGTAVKGDVGNGTSASYEAYMGSSDWWVESTNESGTGTTTVYVKYSNALAAAKDEDTDLGKAVKAAVSDDAYATINADLTSGNIVDIQNYVINKTSGTVTGAQLLNILRAYIDVTYTSDAAGDNQFYTDRSDVFNGYSAAWDVDLLVALSRCIITNTNLLPVETNEANNNIYAISARQNQTQRMNDIASLAGELFGVRGLTSRYQYTYIDSNGEIQDARLDEDMWSALDKMNEMVEEGLVYTGTNLSAGNNSYSYTSGGTTYATTFMLYDYVQTQTANGGFTLDGVTTASTDDTLNENTYNFAPINTPVSLWNDGDTSTEANADGITYDYSSDGEKYMRFTESWRSVKDTGFCLVYDNYVNQPDKLAAALATIDYMFSNDGQILMTYGPMSTVGNTATNNGSGWTTYDDGFWYAEPTDLDLATYAEQVPGSDQWTIKEEYEKDYFVYKNKVYTGGEEYSEVMGPKLTTAMLQLFYGNSVTWLSGEGGEAVQTVKLAENATDTSNTINGISYVLSYTNFARGVIGSALPLGNKMQSFEYQCTSSIGKTGANKVGTSLQNGTISHVYQQIDNEKDNYWYTMVPTTLPYASDVSSTITSRFATNDSNLFNTTSGATDNILIDVIRYGLDGLGTCSGYTMEGTTIPASAAEMVSLINSTYNSMNTYESYMQTAWKDLLAYYNSSIKTSD